MTMRAALLAGASLSALVLTSSLAWADGYERGYVRAAPCRASSIVASNNQISVEYMQQHVDYLETLPNGTRFDAEKGWVQPGIGVNFSLMSSCTRDWWLENLYFNARFSYYAGKTDYTDFATRQVKDGAKIGEFDLRLGKGFGVFDSVMVTPFLGLGYRDWFRDLGPGQYNEDYSHGYVGAGVLLQVSPFKGFVLSADGLVGQTQSAQIAISDFPFQSATPTFRGSTLNLGHSDIYKYGVSADYAVHPQIHVNAGVEWTDFKYGASPVDPTGRYNEPDSRSHNVVFRVGVGYAFNRDAAPAPLK